MLNLWPIILLVEKVVCSRILCILINFLAYMQMQMRTSQQPQHVTLIAARVRTERRHQLENGSNPKQSFLEVPSHLKTAHTLACDINMHLIDTHMIKKSLKNIQALVYLFGDIERLELLLFIRGILNLVFKQQ